MSPADSSDRSQEKIISRSLGGSIAAACMVVFMLAGLLINVVALSSDATQNTSTFNLEEILDGTASNAIADDLAKTSLPQQAAKLQRAANWLVLGDLGPKVRQGCDDWLFLADELATHANADANSKTRAERVKEVHKKLSEKNIVLIVAVVPDKSRIMHDQLCKLRRSATLDNRVQRWVQQLHDSGVYAVDLSKTMQSRQNPLFYRTDTHWNTQGAQLAAQELAGELKKHYQHPLLPHKNTEILTGQPYIRTGDLVRLAGIEWLPQAFQPMAEQSVQLEFKATSNTTAKPEDELFGDTNLPTVVLIGTSFSRTSYFGEFLSHSLQTPVANMSKDGGGFSRAAHEYFRSSAYKQTPPKVVIWEIPERDLQAPLNSDIAVLPL